MNGLTDTLTLGLALTLVFGALFFYLYSRLAQAEKRLSLTENILLDLKMATENTLMRQGKGFLAEEEHEHEDHGSHSVHGQHTPRAQDAEQESSPTHVAPVGGPSPLGKEDVDTETPDESFYQKVLESAATESPAGPIQSVVPPSGAAVTKTAVEPNYESMTRKELKALAEQRGVNLGAHAQKREIIEALRKHEFPVAGSAGGSEGFPVDLGAEEIPV